MKHYQTCNKKYHNESIALEQPITLLGVCVGGGWGGEEGDGESSVCVCVCVCVRVCGVCELDSFTGSQLSQPPLW